MKLSGGQQWKLFEGKETLGVTELWEWLCKNSPLSLSHSSLSLRHCVPPGLVCGVNTLLSNALLSRLEVTLANCLMFGDFLWLTGKKKYSCFYCIAHYLTLVSVLSVFVTPFCHISILRLISKLVNCLFSIDPLLTSFVPPPFNLPSCFYFIFLSCCHVAYAPPPKIPILLKSILLFFLSLRLYILLSKCHFVLPSFAICVCALLFVSVLPMFKHPFASHY